jgi:UrcA family protein
MSNMFFALAASLAAAAATPAVAAPSVPGVRTVSYADLDLSSAAGRGRLDQRVAAAVRAVCGTAAPADLRAAEAVRDCRAATLAQANRTR